MTFTRTSLIRGQTVPAPSISDILPIKSMRESYCYWGRINFSFTKLLSISSKGWNPALLPPEHSGDDVSCWAHTQCSACPQTTILKQRPTLGLSIFQKSPFHKPKKNIRWALGLPWWVMAQTVKSLPAMQEIEVRSLGWEYPLEKEMATHPSVLA